MAGLPPPIPVCLWVLLLLLLHTALVDGTWESGLCARSGLWPQSQGFRTELQGTSKLTPVTGPLVVFERDSLSCWPRLLGFLLLMDRDPAWYAVSCLPTFSSLETFSLSLSPT